MVMTCADHERFRVRLSQPKLGRGSNRATILRLIVDSDRILNKFNTIDLLLNATDE